MGVVELDRRLRGQLPEVVVLATEPPQDIAQRRGGEEELLLQPQCLALLGGIIGIEHAADRPCKRLGLGRGSIFAPVEPLEIEQLQRLGTPQPERVRPLALPADYRRVPRLCDHTFLGLPDRAPARLGHLSAEADLERGLGPLVFPGMGLQEPVLRLLDLPAFDEALPKQTMFVANAIAVGGTTDGRE